MKQSSLNRGIAIVIATTLSSISIPQNPQAQPWTKFEFRRFAQTRAGKISHKRIQKIIAQRTSFNARVSAYTLLNSPKNKNAELKPKTEIDQLLAVIAETEAYFKTHPKLAAAKAKFAKERQADLTRAERELKLGHYTKVVSILHPYAIAHPDEIIGTDTLADAYFQLGRVDDAYNTLMPSLGPTSSRMERIVVRASLAVALMGRSQPGQWEFCAERISRSIGDDSTIQNTLPKTHDHKGLQMLSYLATGLDRAFNGSRDDNMTIFYLHRALELDPGNPVANLNLVDPLKRNERFEEALACLERALPHAGTRDKESYRFELRDLRYIVKSRKESKTTKKPKSGN